MVAVKIVLQWTPETILEYAKKNEITLDLNAIKNILALSAQDLQMPAADQGYGLLNMGKMVSLTLAAASGTITGNIAFFQIDA